MTTDGFELVEFGMTVSPQAAPEKPELVRIDPEYTVLAKVTFDVPDAMLKKQLAATNDVIGRVDAVEVLGKKQDQASVDRLGELLGADPSHAVRSEAAVALRSIHSPAAFSVLTNSQSGTWRNALPGMEIAAKALKMELHEVGVKTVEDFPGAFAAMATTGVEAVVLGEDPLLNSNGSAIAALAMASSGSTCFAAALISKLLSKPKLIHSSRVFGSGILFLILPASNKYNLEGYWPIIISSLCLLSS
jgi:hypothetical protein